MFRFFEDRYDHILSNFFKAGLLAGALLGFCKIDSGQTIDGDEARRPAYVMSLIGLLQSGDLDQKVAAVIGMFAGVGCGFMLASVTHKVAHSLVGRNR